MAFNPPLGSNSPVVLLDNATRLDKLVNGPAVDVPDRAGDLLYSWRQMMAKNDEIRQNLIPLSRQYMTLEAAQADIANIPEGSATYVRSGIGSALADEYINNSGTLEPTGRKMPSQQAVQINDDFRVDVTLGSESQWVDNSSSSAKTTIMADASGREVIYANHSAKKIVVYGKPLADNKTVSELGSETWVMDDSNPTIIIELVDKSGRIVKYLDLASGLYYVFGKAVGTEQSSIVYPTFIPEFMDARSYGQSLSIYSQGTPGLATPTVKTFRFDTGVLTYNKNPTSLVALEDPTSSQYMQSQIHDFQTKVSDASNSEFLLAASGLGGTPFSGLEPGTVVYTQFINTIQKAKDLADARGVQYGMLWFNFQHGETDASQGTGYAYYRQKSKEMQEITNAHVKSISGLNHDVPMFVYQMATHGRYDGLVNPSYEIPLAQLDEAISNPLIQMATPMYIFEYADGLHLTADGYRHRDLFFSKAQKFYYENKKPWLPLYPTKVSRIGNTSVLLDLHIPVGPVQFSTDRVTAATDGMQGFELWAENSAGTLTRLAISSVTIVSGSRIKIVPAIPFNAADKIYLAYAFTPENRGADSGGGIYPNWPAGYTAGCRGNVCDSDDYESDLRDKNGNPYELRNYLTIFRKEAIS
ncbi:hypothetical protein SM907_10615 [Klebsiella aerogenes]|uniref:hypothetical protein n=1 Tax=Klebsiella aerogenes TaxID=548 RepID=UPI002A7EFBD8|nr:hypothetical protein [Klebsiella aerogenes]WPS10395.1 hypothetical protein SM907_10615 [Klebsiella aerogenes]